MNSSDLVFEGQKNYDRSRTNLSANPGTKRDGTLVAWREKKTELEIYSPEKNKLFKQFKCQSQSILQYSPKQKADPDFGPSKPELDQDINP
jgi:hypothetical protein